MSTAFTSESVNVEIDQLLLSGRATSASDAEQMFLDAHLADLAELVVELDEQDFVQHEAIKLLMSHGSRGLEDALR